MQHQSQQLMHLLPKSFRPVEMSIIRVDIRITVMGFYQNFYILGGVIRTLLNYRRLAKGGGNLLGLRRRRPTVNDLALDIS